MTDPYIGEIRMFAGTYAPRGWASCDGGILSINQNQALFSLIGTTYGGDGRSTVGLPDMRDRAPMGYGHGPGLSPREMGEAGGEISVPLQMNQLPMHTHGLNASKDKATVAAATNNTCFIAEASMKKGRSITSVNLFKNTPSGIAAMASGAISTTGGNDWHENRQPFLAILFIINLDGLYPPRPQT